MFTAWQQYLFHSSTGSLVMLASGQYTLGEKKKGILSETPMNREVGGRVVSWELREASAMPLNAWKSKVSDFSPFYFFLFQRALESSSEVSGRWECYGEADWGQEWAGLGKAASSLSNQCTGVGDSEVQRPSGPELQPSVSEEPSAELRWKLEARGWARRMKANHKSCLKSIHAWEKKSNTDKYFKRKLLDTLIFF